MNNSIKPELLAPAGGWEQLKTAIMYGADAVYLACKKYGMRAKANNFDVHELKDVVTYAHEHNVLVYVTCNILMHDKDIEYLPDYVKQLNDANIDALIISDMGAVSIAKQIIPNIDIHISTQASVANSASAIAWAKMGVKRIVLAREMSLKEIALMRNNLNDAAFGPDKIELEAFVHGAMCMSVSGRCLISSYLTNRSANKGLCTQPCRWGYEIDFKEEKRDNEIFSASQDKYGTYIFNSKDLCMINHLNDLANAGISSLKIEGRNKKAMYVATTVNAYRHAIDMLSTTNKNDAKNYSEEIKMWRDELDNISHRPYSSGFYYNEAEQSLDYDGYAQNTIHVADVVSCKEKTYDSHNTKSKKSYKITVLCRNHFENNEILEAIIPYDNIKKIPIRNLKLNNKKIDVANRAKEQYSFDCSSYLEPGTILRSNTKLRTCRK